jgi:hypothetical protein
MRGIVTLYREPFFCTERLNRALTGLCDASLSTRLPSAMLSKLVMSSTLP